MMLSLWALVLGFLLDLLIGDPHFIYHPVRLVGNLITVTEKGLRRFFPKTKGGETAAGVFLAVIVISVTTAVPALLLYLAGRISPEAVSYTHLMPSWYRKTLVRRALRQGLNM